MEDNKEYKLLTSFKANINLKLDQLEEQSEYFHQQRRIIEENFERVVHAIEARKQFLIEELDEIVLEKEIYINNAKVNLKNALDTCNELLSVGSAAYKLNEQSGELIWKHGAQNMDKSSFEKQRTQLQLEINMPAKLLEDIKIYGTVAINSTLSQQSDIQLNSYKQVNEVSTFAWLDSGFFSTQSTGCSYDIFEDCLYVCYGSEIKKVSIKGGKVSTFVAKQESGKSVFSSIAMHHATKTSYCTVNCKIFRVSATGKATPIVHSDNNASFYGIIVDQETGNGFVTDIFLNTICQVTSTGISVLAGSGHKGSLDGIGHNASFNTPMGMCWDGNSLLVCDKYNDAIRRVSMKGQVATVCKVEKPAFIAITPAQDILVTSDDCKEIFIGKRRGSGRYEAYKLLVGPVQVASFSAPRGIVLHEASRSAFVCDGNRIRKLCFV